mmetsp:Transcript_9494/g.24165  ORF Transcript_9494/g.24165 Transcript_9494/m.24165 type:complete len:104 (-) Transcript_9494:448-759(-)
MCDCARRSRKSCVQVSGFVAELGKDLACHACIYTGRLLRKKLEVGQYQLRRFCRDWVVDSKVASLDSSCVCVSECAWLWLLSAVPRVSQCEVEKKRRSELKLS